ncbi:hypothetical protein EWM64_g5631 [Hericium alpestre]|uniref:Uncharacterized protein n=1 Tax=Hericium alpestre TaxID=135208 RepID=A0A4Y9ZWF7_9AGAM|nr:hypothetical protein EWM64_g5631 [Hericium alpestre]
MLSLPGAPEHGGLPCAGDTPTIDVSEDSKLLHVLLSCAQVRYDMGPAITAMRALLLKGEDSLITEENAFRAYGVACRHRLPEEASMAARATLLRPMSIKTYGEDLHLVTGSDLYALSQYRYKCIEAICVVMAGITAGEALELWVADPVEGMPCRAEYGGNYPKWLTGFFKALARDVQNEDVFPSAQSMDRWRFHGTLLSHCGPVNTRTGLSACGFCKGLSDNVVKLEHFCQTVQDLINVAIRQVKLDCAF